MPKKLEYKPSLSRLGKYLVKNDITIAQLMRCSGLAHRTTWLAVHGYSVSYNSAVKIIMFLEKFEKKQKKNTRSKSKGHGVTINSLCSGKSRAEFVSTTE